MANINQLVLEDWDNILSHASNAVNKVKGMVSNHLDNSGNKPSSMVKTSLDNPAHNGPALRLAAEKKENSGRGIFRLTPKEVESSHKYHEDLRNDPQIQKIRADHHNGVSNMNHFGTSTVKAPVNMPATSTVKAPVNNPDQNDKFLHNIDNHKARTSFNNSDQKVQKVHSQSNIIKNAVDRYNNPDQKVQKMSTQPSIIKGAGPINSSNLG